MRRAKFQLREENCRRCLIMQKKPEIDDNLPEDKTRTRRCRNGFQSGEMEG